MFGFGSQLCSPERDPVKVNPSTVRGIEDKVTNKPARDVSR